MNRKQRILLADGSRFFRTIESKFLQKSPVEVLETADVATTQACLRNDPPDLVYLAYELAVAGEPTFCALLKSDPATREVPVVVICDQNAPEQPVNARLMGADACLVKPLDRHSFLQVVRQYLSSVREHRQPSFFPLSFTFNGLEFTGKCLDISGGGMFIETHTELTVGASINLVFRLPDSMATQVACQAVVTWQNCKPKPIKPHYPYGFGVKFSTLSDGERQAIARLLGKRTKP